MSSVLVNLPRPAMEVLEAVTALDAGGVGQVFVGNGSHIRMPQPLAHRVAASP